MMRTTRRSFPGIVALSLVLSLPALGLSGCMMMHHDAAVTSSGAHGGHETVAKDVAKPGEVKGEPSRGAEVAAAHDSEPRSAHSVWMWIPMGIMMAVMILFVR